MRYPLSDKSTVILKPTPPDPWNPVAIWYEFRRGNELAFTALYKKYVTSLYHYGERITPDKELIEDSIHDFFVELWNRRHRYGEVNDLTFYLLRGFKYRLLKNIKQARRLQTTVHVADDYHFEIVFSREFELIHAQSSEENKRQVLNSINQLSKREKEAITLRFYDGLSYEEIAAMMSLSIKSTYKLMYRAMNGLKKNVSMLYTFVMALLVNGL